jgi:fructokinase
MCWPQRLLLMKVYDASTHMKDSLRLGVDLGGTKTEAVVLRVRPDASPEVLARHRVPTERDEGYAHVIDTVADTIETVRRDAGVREAIPVGIGMPGSLTSAGLVKNSNTTCLNGRPFHDDLRARVGVPIEFDNDANCFALAEASLGAARGLDVVFGVIMGTGVGGGVVVRGRAWSGPQGIAGEWGHIPLEPRDGPACYCGRRGCVETYLSGPAIERRYASRTGESMALPDIAASDSVEARATIDEALETFGRALAIVIDVLDPSAIVLGGGVSNIPAFYDRGREAVARWTFTDELTTPILKNALGDSAGVFGAAMLGSLE